VVCFNKIYGQIVPGLLFRDSEWKAEEMALSEIAFRKRQWFCENDLMAESDEMCF
jgi:hypothetical protein